MRPTLKDCKKKALPHPESSEEYRRVAPAYELRRHLIKIRKDAGLTQEQIAEILQTNKSNIPRLEGSLKNSEFRSRSRRARKFYRRHMHDIPRIKFDCATMRLGKMAIFQGSLENVNSTSSPKLSTIEQYAKAAGYKVQIRFIPHSQ
jgi:DNA-binding transcriptional MerR regulator